MNDSTVSDACLEFVPLTTADRAEQQSIAVWVDGEKVPNLRRINVGPRDLKVSVVPCRALLRLKELARARKLVRIEYTCKKARLVATGAVETYDECITWPAGISEVSFRLHTIEPWAQEAL